jgi:hypothetical protein
MATSDELLIKLIESLAAEGCVTADFEASVIGMVGKMRIARNRAIRDMEAASLLHLGSDVLVERFGVKKRAVYYMAERGRKHSATPAPTIAQTG